MKTTLTAALLAAAFLAPQDPPLKKELTDTWVGRWTAPDGWLYSGVLQLGYEADGSLKGRIDWTLVKTPRAEEQDKVGLTGTELVKGSFDPGPGLLTIEGYDKKDPNSILGLDKYRLLLAPNDSHLGGITWHHGKWNGLFHLARKEK